jgi:periplasmic protein CpxP/Spy
MRLLLALSALWLSPPPVSVGAEPHSSAIAADSLKERTPKDREEMERQFREALEQLVRERLGLTEEKIKALRVINDQFRPDYRRLWDKEKGLRQELRTEMDKESAANQQRIDEILGETWEVQLQRHILFKAEQRELAKVLTPLQRAKYWSIQMELMFKSREKTRTDNGENGKKS